MHFLLLHNVAQATNLQVDKPRVMPALMESIPKRMLQAAFHVRQVTTVQMLPLALRYSVLLVLGAAMVPAHVLIVQKASTLLRARQHALIARQVTIAQMLHLV